MCTSSSAKCEALRKESAVPAVATPASYKAYVQVSSGVPNTHFDVEFSKHSKFILTNGLWPCPLNVLC